MYLTIKDHICEEIVVKKSRFIANIYYVKNKEEAEDIINKVRKKYYDARHNCYAYNIIDEENKIQSKSSDDGEPSGTAGAPMLDILNKKQMANVLVIVTRYFGGILLGTGGLVRAYSDATLKAIENAIIVNEENGYELKIILNYNDLDKLKLYCNKNCIEIVNIEYDEKINCVIEVNENEKDLFLKNINEFNFKIENIDILCTKKIRKIMKQ